MSRSGASVALGNLAGTGGGGAAVSNATPQPLGSAGPGTSDEASRADHVHAMPSATDVGALGLTAQAADSAKLGGVTPTVAGLALLDDVNAAAQRTTLGLGDSATKNVGTAAGTVAAGDHTHTTLPTSDEKAALAGTSGTPSATNKFVTDDDSRLTGGLAAALTVSAFGGF